MCLIIAGKASLIVTTLLNTQGLLRDIYDSNKDGVGAMYCTTKNKLRTPKLVGQFDAVEKFVQQLPQDDRDLAIHFRMKTHGLIDLTNCHPYPVLQDRIAMMHNGVLSWVDDKSDLSKSDTWHYIEQFARPQLEACPQLFLVPAWRELVSEHIGTSNRFVFMDNEGNCAIVNRHTGLDVKLGDDVLWFSNEYAWDPALLIPNRKKKSKWSGYSGSWDDHGVYDYYEAWRSQHGGTTVTSGNAGAGGRPASNTDVWAGQQRTFFSDAIRKDVRDAVQSYDPDALDKVLDEYPITALDELLENFEFTCSVEPDQLSKFEGKIAAALETGDRRQVSELVRKSPSTRKKVAEVICWYGDWIGKTEQKKVDFVVGTDGTVMVKPAQVPALLAATEKKPGEELTTEDVQRAILAANCRFKAGEVYYTRDALGLRLVVSVTHEEVLVRDIETGGESTRWLDGQCLIAGTTGRDLVGSPLSLKELGAFLVNSKVATRESVGALLWDEALATVGDDVEESPVGYEAADVEHRNEVFAG